MEDEIAWPESPERTSPAQTVTPALATAFWQLLTTQHQWIHRRVETIDVLSGEMVKRTMSVDFTVPARLRDDLKIDGGYIVPLALLSKEPRRNFSASLAFDAGEGLSFGAWLGSACLAAIVTAILTVVMMRSAPRRDGKG